MARLKMPFFRSNILWLLSYSSSCTYYYLSTAYQRQNSKSDLAMALEGCDGDEPPQERDDESSSAGRSDVKMSVRRQSLTKRDVLLLLDPTASRLENSKKGSIDKKSVGWRSSSVVDSDEEGSQLEEEQDCADAEEGGEAVACAMKISAQDIPSSCAPVDDVVAQTVQELAPQVLIIIHIYA